MHVQNSMCRVASSGRSATLRTCLLTSCFKFETPFRCMQVDPQAFDTLVECVTQGNFDTCESIGQGDPSGKLVNPLGGISVDLAGPAG